MIKKTGIFLGLLLAINILAYLFYFRIDLTADQRYSLSKASKEILHSLKNQVVIKVYLDGDDLPGGFERLKKGIHETLDEFQNQAGNNINYQFINPSNETEENRKKLFKSLVEKGMHPTNIFDNKGGKKTENLLFPYATVWYEGKETNVLLLKANQAENAQVKLNQSNENLEYELISAIKKLTETQRKKIGLLTEFTVLRPINFAGLINSLQEYYDLFIIDTKKSSSFSGLDAIIVPKPEKTIDDETKFKLDQFIMNDGKTLFFVDGLKVDSVGLEGSYAQALNVNLDDLFFRYGLRINKNMVKDGLNAAVIPLVVGNMGNKPNIQMMPYRYFPMINNFGKSLITKNIDMVYTKFAADISTVNPNDGLKKTPLLITSKYTKTLNAPAIITYNEARTDTDQKEYNGGEKVIGYLVEGKFKSLFQNSIADKKAKSTSNDTKILVCSDGDMLLNDVDRRTGNPMPMGFDKYSQHIYGNQDFVLNALNYMLDQNGLIEAKSKSVGLRPLDSLKIRDEGFYWKLLNFIAPLMILAIAGVFRMLWIKKRYAA